MKIVIVIGICVLLVYLFLFSSDNVQTGDSKECPELDKSMHKLVEEANNCDVDSDCLIQSGRFDCPFGCYYMFNKNVDLDQIET